MKKILTLVALFMTVSLFAQGDMTQSSIQGIFGRNQEQIMGLAGAFSADQYDWRPAEGVRSVGESLMHVAQANYFFMMKLGFALPEGVDMMAMGSTSGKEAVMAAVKNSFDFAKDKITMVESSQFGDKVEMPFGEFTKLSSLLILMEHSGEHKGQLIAYARANGITPPWSE